MTHTLLSFIQAAKHPDEPGWSGSFKMWEEDGASFRDADEQHRSLRWNISKLNNNFEVVEFIAQCDFTIKQFLDACLASGFEDITNRHEIYNLLASSEDLTELKNALMNINFEREFQGSDFQGSFDDSNGREWLLSFGTFSRYEWLGENESDIGYGNRDDVDYCEETICFDRISLTMSEA